MVTLDNLSPLCRRKEGERAGGRRKRVAESSLLPWQGASHPALVTLVIFAIGVHLIYGCLVNYRLSCLAPAAAPVGKHDVMKKRNASFGLFKQIKLKELLSNI